MTLHGCEDMAPDQIERAVSDAMAALRRVCATRGQLRLVLLALTVAAVEDMPAPSRAAYLAALVTLAGSEGGDGLGELAELVAEIRDK